MIVLGLNAYHGDAAACLVRDGAVVAAAEEERFRRIKHWAGFPSEAIGYCLSEAGVQLADVDAVAINADPGAAMLKRIGYAVRHRPDIRLVGDRLQNRSKRRSIGAALQKAFPRERFRAEVIRVEHHVAHLASAFLASPFEKAAVLSVDGLGDFASAAWGEGCGGRISVEGRVHFPHSLGIFYQALTQYLGFPDYGDEYKVMGLAPYGAPRFMGEMRRLVSLGDDGRFALDTRYFRHHREKVAHTWDGGAPRVGPLYAPALADLLGPPRRMGEPLSERHRDIARSVQSMYEEAFLHVVRHVHGLHGHDALALAGGCAMNSVANGKVIGGTPFRRLFVPAAAGDAGGAIGAALHAAHQLAEGRPQLPPATAYLGPETPSGDITRLLAQRASALEAGGCETAFVADEQMLSDTTAEAIAGGEIVGWFQGRMEWGPRALGNRSILADPRRADMKDVLNRKIKRREGFRPFAPSVLREHAGDWFDGETDVPFMTVVLAIRPEKRALVPAVTHVDGTGRLQTVEKGANPRYWRLIEAFRQRTGVPMVLNTSFNESEPIVCRAEEALDCFLRTRMDRLVLGNWVVRRGSAAT